MTMARRRGEDLRRRGSGGRRSVASSPPLAMAIKRGSTKLYNLMSDYIKTVPVEITAMVGVDAFDAFKFTNDARDAFHALRDLDFAELGTIHYEHIYSALDREGDDWYGRSKFVHDDSIDVRAIAKFYRDVVHLTETLRRRNGRRIAIDDAEGSSN
jgi:NAD(P)H-flavin reductase